MRNLWTYVEVTLIGLWALLLVLIIFNAYNYLYKMTKYKFAPMVMLYVGNAVLACLVVVYFSERLDMHSRVWRSESAPIFFQSNMRLACTIAILGFIGLIVELRLMLLAINESSESQIAQIQKLKNSVQMNLQGRRETG